MADQHVPSANSSALPRELGRYAPINININILNAQANALQLSGPYRYRSLDTASREALYEEVMHAVLNYR